MLIPLPHPAPCRKYDLEISSFRCINWKKTIIYKHKRIHPLNAFILYI